eukprot:663840-Prorocentrum_minimum.AAC.1
MAVRGLCRGGVNPPTPPRVVSNFERWYAARGGRGRLRVATNSSLPLSNHRSLSRITRSENPRLVDTWNEGRVEKPSMIPRFPDLGGGATFSLPLGRNSYVY